MKRISVLMATAFVDMIGFAIVFPLLPLYALRFDADPWMIGWLIAAFSVMQLTAAPLWGRFSDRYGRRPAIILGLCTSAIAFAVFAFANTILLLFLTRLVQGIGGGTTGVAQAYVGDSIEPRDRARALGWLSAATSAGVMIGPAIGSLAFGLGPEYPGLIASGLCFTNIIFAWRWLPESSPKARPASEDGAPSKRRSTRAVMLEVVTSPTSPVPRLIWIYTVGMLGFMSMTAVITLYLEARFAVTEQTIGPIFVYIGFLSILMRALVLGPAVDMFGETRVMRAGAVSLALGLFAIPFPATLLGTAAVMSLVPIGTALLFPNCSALVTHRAPSDHLGQVLGVQQSFGGMARVIAPVWATAVFQVGPTVPFFVSAGVVAFVTLLAFNVKHVVVAPEAAAEV
jgi:MFS family permease